METFTAYTVEGVNQFSFDLLIKNNTYAFYNFFPTKESPEKVKIIISLYEKSNTLIGEETFVLELDKIKKKYNEHLIGLSFDGLTQKMVLTAFNPDNGLPLNKICIGVAVAKIKDNNGGNILN